MSGTSDGGKRAAKTNQMRHGRDFYARIGAIGGAKGTTGGFAANRELARIAGAKGGSISRRRPGVKSAKGIKKVTKVVVTSVDDDQMPLAA